MPETGIIPRTPEAADMYDGDYLMSSRYHQGGSSASSYMAMIMYRPMTAVRSSSSTDTTKSACSPWDHAWVALTAVPKACVAV